MDNYTASVQITKEIARLVKKCGGQTYYVGGYVRDTLRKTENKDIDIEIHGIIPSCLEEILDGLGNRISMGESFGIYNLKGYSVDIAMPRKETLKGKCHKDFDIFVDPFIGTFSAAKRRDFTINALMQDVLTGEIIDHFGGINDLNNKVLRHISDETFIEDPLRVLRGAQFAARFDMSLAEETAELFKNMDLSNLPRERIEGELKKALLKSEHPSIFFEILRKTDRLEEWFPEVKNLIGVEQNPRFHSEGDVWNHTMLVLDEAAKLRKKANDPFGFMLAALSHDFGKVATTKVINGAIHSYNHESLGLPITETFLKRISNETRLIEYVLNLCKLHMKPNICAAATSKIKTTNKMFDDSIDPEALIALSIADDKGSLCIDSDKDHSIFLYERLEIFREYMSRPYVMGKDLISAGLKPDKSFSEILEYAHKLRLAGIDKSTALMQTLHFANKLKVGTNQ